MPRASFEPLRRLAKMWSVRIQAGWAAACAAYVALPVAEQTSLLALAGVTQPGAIVAASLFAQVSIAISAATIAARAAKQKSLEQ